MPSQKGPGKKGRGAAADARQSRSRKTTPNSAAGAGVVPPSSDTSETALLGLSVRSLATFDGFDANSSTSIPDAKGIDVDIDALGVLMTTAETRGEVSNTGMRKLSPMKRGRQEEIQQDLQRDAARKENEEVRKKRKESSKAKERPLTHGAHAAAPQDGSIIGVAKPKRSHAVRNDREAGSASSSLSPVPQATPGPAAPDVEMHPAPASNVPENGSDDESSTDEHQPPPAEPVQNSMVFGDNPLIHPDNTRYHIPAITPDMSEAVKKDILGVAEYPHDDLSDLIPGTPPDKDFSNAKPTGQVQANTFGTYLEPYFRPFSEEDLAFLRDGGDRVSPFIMPPRGKKHYKEIWAEEDGTTSIDQASQRRPQNQGRGSIEDMNDTVAETDQISLPPMMSRLVALVRPEHRAQNQTDADGDENMGDNDELTNILSGASSRPEPLPPATRLPGLNSDSLKRDPQKTLNDQYDARLKMELKNMGFLESDFEPNYEEHRDDEIAERNRILQHQLKLVQTKNNARKAILDPIVREQMSYQEYNTIVEDLDNQTQAAYTKRTRTMGKSKKTKRAGGAGGGSHAAPSGMARPGIGDVTKTIMDRRGKWKDTIGPIFENEADLNKVPREKDEGSSIFTPEKMAPYIEREKRKWEEDVDEDLE